MSETKIERAALLAAAKELNTLLDPDPKIKTVGVKTDGLIAAIKTAASLLADGDALTAETHDVLCALKINLPEALVVASGTDINEDDEPAAPEAPADIELEREDYANLIDEMNKVMELDPAIEYDDDTTDDGLKAKIKANCYDKGECQVFDTDKFSSEAWGVLKALGVQAIVTKKAKAEKPAKAEKAAKPAKEKPAKADKVKKVKDGSALNGPGIIKTIATTIKEQGPITKEGILAVLVEKFPDRDADAMKKTINVQVPNRINKEQDFTIENSDKGWKVAGKAKK